MTTTETLLRADTDVLQTRLSDRLKTLPRSELLELSSKLLTDQADAEGAKQDTEEPATAVA